MPFISPKHYWTK